MVNIESLKIDFFPIFASTIMAPRRWVSRTVARKPCRECIEKSSLGFLVRQFEKPTFEASFYRGRVMNNHAFGGIVGPNTIMMLKVFMWAIHNKYNHGLH